MVGSGEPPTLNAIPLVQLFVCTGTFICVVRGDGVRVSLPGQYGYKYSWPVDVSATTAAAIAAAIVGRRACRVLPFRFVSSPFLPRSLFLSLSLSLSLFGLYRFRYSALLLLVCFLATAKFAWFISSVCERAECLAWLRIRSVTEQNVIHYRSSIHSLLVIVTRSHSGPIPPGSVIEEMGVVTSPLLPPPPNPFYSGPLRCLESVIDIHFMFVFFCFRLPLLPFRWFQTKLQKTYFGSACYSRC